MGGSAFLDRRSASVFFFEGNVYIFTNAKYLRLTKLVGPIYVVPQQRVSSIGRYCKLALSCDIHLEDPMDTVNVFQCFLKHTKVSSERKFIQSGAKKVGVQIVGDVLTLYPEVGDKNGTEWISDNEPSEKCISVEEYNRMPDEEFGRFIISSSSKKR